MPPLVLQPLLENAVYHGIEPRSEPGVITHRASAATASSVHLMLRNPYRPSGDHHAGNRMALANIRERLAAAFRRRSEHQYDGDRRHLPGAHRDSAT